MILTRRVTRIEFQISFLILCVMFGYLLDVIIEEEHSLRYFNQEPREDLFILLYPLYLICRTQCFVLYLVCLFMSFTGGLVLLYLLARSLLREILIVTYPSVILDVRDEYIGIIS